MRYIFERGQYPHEVIIADLSFDSNEQAVEHAKKINADYCWDVPDNCNPNTVYVKSWKFNELG